VRDGALVIVLFPYGLDGLRTAMLVWNVGALLNEVARKMPPETDVVVVATWESVRDRAEWEVVAGLVVDSTGDTVTGIAVTLEIEEVVVGLAVDTIIGTVTLGIDSAGVVVLCRLKGAVGRARTEVASGPPLVIHRLGKSYFNSVVTTAGLIPNSL